MKQQAQARWTRLPRRFGDLWTSHLLGLCAGLLGLLCSLALPFAPVWTDETSVHWPRADGPAEPTVALFAPYRPAEFTAKVPCSTLRSALDQPRPTTILSTLPPDSPRKGLVLTTRDAEPHLVLNQREVPLPPLAADCDLTVHADSERSTVQAGRAPPTTVDDSPAPEIFTFSTSLAPEQAADLAVDAKTHSWFDTSPTAFKYVLIVFALALGALSLALLTAQTPPTVARLRRALTEEIRLSTLAPALVDVAVAAILLLWLVIGPLTDDDGFATMTVRNFANTGDIGNYYRWFNASEAPFTLVQHLMRWFTDGSLAPAWLRVPSVLAGFLTWLAVGRGIVAPLCRDAAIRDFGPHDAEQRTRPRQLGWHLLAAVSFLACWLPFGLGIRPEAFIALGTTAVVALLLKATSPTTRTALFWLGSAALITGLTVAITPTGVAAPITVLAFAPRIWHVLARNGPRAVPGRIAMLAALGSIGVVAMFADSTFRGVQEANRIHDEFGPSLGWYQEINRYSSLLGTTHWGAAGKRVAVLIVLAALLLCVACMARGAHRAARLSDTPLLAVSVVAVFVALWLTPSKWTHHFGALAGLGAALVPVAVLLLLRLGARSRRDARTIGGIGAVAVSLAAALAFTGPNSWWQYSDLAMPWSDGPIRLGGVRLDSPLFWLALGVAAGLVVHVIQWALHRTPLGHAWTAMPAAVLTGTALTSTIVLLGSFTAAAQQPGFSVARTNRDSIRDTSCGIESAVQTLPLADNTSRPAEGRDELDGFTRAAAGPPQEPDPGPQRTPGEPNPPVTATPHVWSSSTASTGTLHTKWFTLPALKPHQTLSVWLSGRPEQGNSLTAEFGTARGGQVRPAGQHRLTDPPPEHRPYDDPRHGRPKDWRDFSHWRLLTIDADQLPAGANRVRLHAADRTTDDQGRLSVSAPVVRDVVPLHRMLDARPPALIDWQIGFLFPCRYGYPAVGHGLAESPGLLVTPPEGEGSMAFDPEYGGVFAGTPMSSRRLETPSRLAGSPGVTWGHVYAVDYGIDRDGYDRTQRQLRTNGLSGSAELSGEYPFEKYDRR